MTARKKPAKIRTISIKELDKIVRSIKTKKLKERVILIDKAISDLDSLRAFRSKLEIIITNARRTGFKIKGAIVIEND